MDPNGVPPTVRRKRSLALLATSVLAVLLLIATLGLSILTSRRLASSSARVDHTMLVKVAAADLLGTLLEAETGQRGYLLTGRAEYLEPYRRARNLASARIDRLRVLTADSEAQQVLVARIAQLTTDRLDELRQAIDRHDRDGQDVARAVVDTDADRHTMGALHGKLDDLETIEDMLLAVRRERQQRYASQALSSLVVVSVFFGLLAGLVVLWGRTAEVHRSTMEAEAARLRAENDALAARNGAAQLQERFTAILGHDLRNPLSSVTMGLQLLRNHPLSQQQATLDRMVSSTARMSRMIDQLLDLTRSRLGGGIAVRPAAMNLGKLVTEVTNEACTAHGERALVVEVTGDLEGEWDSDRLAQVVSNLVGNALVHGTPAGPVRVTACGGVDTVEVAVSNPGPALPPALKRVLFDPFRRGQQAGEMSRTSGLGLGLYIAREIVVAHGGALDIVSPDAEETTFRMVLPRVLRTSAQEVCGQHRAGDPRVHGTDETIGSNGV